MKSDVSGEIRMNSNPSDPSSRKTAVIIPYYQEEPGILRRAVSSAIAQEGVSELEIIVVDDGSPAPARDELQGLELPIYVTLKLLEQPNRGPGAARNRGLDAISRDTMYVAFLDSDDQWTEDHLERAVFALRMGYDFYFANHSHSDARESQWDRCGRPIREVCLDPAQDVYRFVGMGVPNPNRPDRLWSPPLGGHLSTLVLRSQRLGGLRFSNEVVVGEDRLFWRELVARSDKGIFSGDIESISGNGVHIGESSQWGAPRAIWRAYQYMKWRRWLQRNFKMTKEQVRDNYEFIRQLRKQFALVFWHDTARMRSWRNPWVYRFFWLDPAALLLVIPIAGQVLAQKLTRWRLATGSETSRDSSAEFAQEGGRTQRRVPLSDRSDAARRPRS